MTMDDVPFKSLRYRKGDKVRFKDIPDPPYSDVVNKCGYVQYVHKGGYDYHVSIDDQYFLMLEAELEDVEGEIYE